MNEIDKINQAVDTFASKIKTRMTNKYNEGYRGWDGEYPESALIKELIADAEDIKLNTPIKEFPITCTHVLNRRLIDIGARSMMIWYRHNNPLNPTLKSRVG